MAAPRRRWLAGPEADEWVSAVLELDARLVYLDDTYGRPSKPEYSEPGDVVSFADAFPVLLASEDSLAMLNDWIAEGPRSDEGPLPMTRFRPNLIVRGAPSFDEDTWARIRVGDAEFRVVKDCDRCVITTLDPLTGEKQMEPIATLARHRKWGGKTWFAVNMIPDTEDAVVRVGDEVEVLERRDAGELGGVMEVALESPDSQRWSRSSTRSTRTRSRSTRRRATTASTSRRCATRRSRSRWCGSTGAVGCGAVVVRDGEAELKRMFVDPERRGAGIGTALVAFLEAEAARAVRRSRGWRRASTSTPRSRCTNAPATRCAGRSATTSRIR